MATVTDICNTALSYVGSRGTITSLDETSTEARVCKAHYEITRDVVLSEADWGFASANRVLAQLSEDPPTGWSYVYEYPNNCLKARFLVQASRTADRLPFAVMMNNDDSDMVIACDVDEAQLRYTKRVENPALFPPLFAEAFALRLAARIAMPIVREPKMVTTLMQNYSQARAIAIAASMNESQRDEPVDADWIQARDE
ncbi:MAG: hypothetical protein DRP45_08725 [Candidatus Zixiibacteriota bacterium]|nr:MAG: hypothetical protein DRP45_08725 [candidate division Zixibacteria bacterium]